MTVDPAGPNRQTTYGYYGAGWTDDEKAAGAFGNAIKETRPVGGEHGWGANKSEAFFRKHLKATH